LTKKVCQFFLSPAWGGSKPHFSKPNSNLAVRVISGLNYSRQRRTELINFIMAAFGFSAGDFVAVIKLVSDIGTALSESRGSVNEVRSIVQLLASLTNALEEAKTVFSAYLLSSSPAEKQEAASIINGMVMEIKICHEIILDFLRRSRSYTEVLLNGKGSRVKREWKKISWCLFRQDDVRALERMLQGHLFALNVYTSAQFR
jgi:hypothetical protein